MELADGGGLEDPETEKVYEIYPGRMKSIGAIRPTSRWTSDDAFFSRVPTPLETKRKYKGKKRKPAVTLSPQSFNCKGLDFPLPSG